MRLAHDRLGETVPVGLAIRDQVPGARCTRAATQDIGRRVGDPRCRGRCTDLVGDHAQFVALTRQPQHGAQEVLAVRGIHPGRAQDRVARAAGETAAIMFTASVFYTPKGPDSIFSPVMALPYHMYVLATAGTEIDKTRPLQYGTGLVLLLLVLGMNLLAIILRDRLQKRY